MAESADIPGLRPDLEFRAAAGLTVAARTRELAASSEGVLDVTDIERVHDMRVATRRLRAVLEFYAPCFPHKRLRRTLSAVKDLADALGERRDPDVHIEALDAFAGSGGPELQAGLAEYRRRLVVQQENANVELAAALQAARDPDLVDGLDALVRAVGPEGKASS